MKYLHHLLDEPGFPIASAISFIGFLGGATANPNYEEWFMNGLVGALMMSIFWIPVLLSAYDR